MSFDKFVSDFCCWFNKFENTKGKTKLLSGTLKHIAEEILPSRDEQRLFQVRSFTNSKDMKFNLIYRNLWCTSDKDKGLLVGTLAPNWNNGWKGVSKDEIVADQIDLFFHFANQYITRSYQINLIGSIAFTYNRYCDFRGDFLSQCKLPFLIDEFEKFRDNIKPQFCKKIEIIKHHLNIINALDPYVNKAIYYYVKSIDLYDKDFYEEAITNLDNSIDVVTQFFKERLRLATMGRQDMLNILDNQIGLGRKVLTDLEKLYLLRCQFASHPALSKWWDFGEIYDDYFQRLFESVKFSLIKMFEYEANNRLITQNPEKWSDWFKENADKVYSSIWFDKLP